MQFLLTAGFGPRQQRLSPGLQGAPAGAGIDHAAAPGGFGAPQLDRCRRAAVAVTALPARQAVGLLGVAAELDDVPLRLPGRDLGFGGRHGGAHSRVAVSSQARTPAGSIVISMVAGSSESIRQPSVKAARSCSPVSRCGPMVPGWRSLKHSMR